MREDRYQQEGQSHHLPPAPIVPLRRKVRAHMAATRKTDPSTEIEKRLEFTNDELLNLTDFQSALDLLESKGGALVAAHEVIGNGFAMLDDKSKLVDMPMIILEWKKHQGTYGDFTTMLLITKNNEKFIVTDGSGIPAQLDEVEARTGRRAGLAVAHGFTKSEYEFCQTCRTSRPENECADYEDHKKTKQITAATSFYLDLTA